MCGRYETPRPHDALWRQLREMLHLSSVPPPDPRSEIRPTDPAPIVANDSPHEVVDARWWIEGPWPAKGPGKLTLFNTRDDALGGRFWRAMVETQRCIVPASAFWEWPAVPGQKMKQQTRIARGDGVMLFAGVWSRWQDRLSFSIITTAANNAMAPIHDRMPVILEPDAARAWLDPSPRSIDELSPLLRPCASELLVISAVPQTPPELPLFARR